MKTFSQFSESIARTLVKKIPWKDTATKVAGTVFAAKSGEELLKKLFGTKDNPPSGMRDVYNKDVTSNADFDGILNPSGDQKTKPTLKQLRTAAKSKNKNKEKK